MTKKPTITVSTRKTGRAARVVLGITSDNDITARLKAAWDTLQTVRLDTTLSHAQIYNRVTVAMNAITDTLNVTELILTRAEALALAQEIESWADDLPAPRRPRQPRDSSGGPDHITDALHDYYDKVTRALVAQPVVQFTPGKTLVWRRSTAADQEGTTP